MPSEFRLRNSWFPSGMAALLLTASLLCGGLPADEPLPDDAAPPTAKLKSESSAEEDKPSEFDEKLAEMLGLTGGKIESEIEQLERAISAMRDAGTRISDEDTGNETQKLQEQAVRDLERLIKLLNAREQNQNQNNNQNQQNDSQQELKNHLKQRQKLRRNQLKPQNSGSRNQQSPQKNKGGPERSDADRSRDSQERNDPSRHPEDEQARREKTVKDVWGHLPPHLREALQNNFSEKYLPKYEELVKRYYEALADKNRRPDR